jgi:hypothetical protein
MPTRIPNLATEAPEKLHQRLRDRIGKRSWTVLEVLPDQGGPVFYYTVGLTAMGLPELLVFGLDPATGQKALENVAEKLVRGLPAVDGILVRDVLRNVPVSLREMRQVKADSHMRYANEFFPGAVRGMQVIWPDTAGVFPWQQNFDQSMAVYQRFLTETLH